jgi:hypothetical protein
MHTLRDRAKLQQFKGGTYLSVIRSAIGKPLSYATQHAKKEPDLAAGLLVMRVQPKGYLFMARSWGNTGR